MMNKNITLNNKNIQISQETILISKEHVLFYREGRFQEYLKSLTESEENVLVALAKKEFTISPQSKYFVGLTDYTARTIGKTIRRLVDEGIVEKDKRGYFVSDVLLKLFLKEYR